MITLSVRWGSLRNKIIAWSFVPTVIILAAVALVVYFAYQRVTEELVLERDRELAYFSAAQLKTDLENYSDALLAVTRNSDLRSNDRLRQRGALREASRLLAHFDAGVLILDHFGQVIATEPTRPELSKQDWSDRPYFRQILYSRRPIFSDIVNDGPQGVPVVVFAVPITGEKDEFLGILAGMFRLGAENSNPFYGSIAKVRIGQTGEFHLVDGKGDVIYHSKAQHIGEDFTDRISVQQVLNGNIGSNRSRDFEGRDIVAAFAPVPGTTWGLVLEDDWAALSQSEERYGLFLLLLLVTGIALPALVVSIGVKRITDPVQSLIAAAQQVAEGNFGLIIDARTGDEIEDLTNQFNRMSTELKESYALLEQKVAARTKELAALYEVSAAASSSLELNTVLQRSLDQVLKVMGLEIGTIHLLDSAGKALDLVASNGVDEDKILQIYTVSLGEGLASWAVELGEPLVILNIGEAPRPLLAIPADANQAYVGVPIVARGQELGVLSLVGEPGREFKSEEVALLASIADDIALAVDNARLFAQAEQLAKVEKRRREVAESLRDILSVLNSNKSLTEILTYILQRAHPLMDADAGAIYCLDWDRGVFSLQTTSGSLMSMEPVEMIPFGNWEMLEGVSESQPFFLHGISQKLDLLYPDAETLTEKQRNWLKVIGKSFDTFLCIPILIKDGIYGYVAFYYKQFKHLTREHISLGASLGDQAALAIENARLYEQAEKLAVIEERGRLARELHDSVTQLLYSLTLFAEAGQRMNRANDQERTDQFLSRVSETARQAHREMRLLIYELRPPTLEKEGLVGALRHRLDTVEKRSGMEANLQVEGVMDLPAAIEDCLFRASMEALNNVLKHASATRVTVSLISSHSSVSLQIVDNGTGFDLESAKIGGGLGLRGMQERIEPMGGCLEIKSKRGQGTRVTIWLQKEVVG